MQCLEVSGAVRHLYVLLDFKGLIKQASAVQIPQDTLITQLRHVFKI